MKLLIYGGCHALVLKQLVDGLGVPGRHAVDLLINYQLIASGAAFPYEALRSYDAVVYSPIENKPGYNTTALDAACAAAGVQAVRFPWLEWHGYAPGIAKGMFQGHHGWYFPGLVALSRDFADPATFARVARAEFPSDERIRAGFEASTERLAAQEQRFDCDIRVSPFILDRYRDHRVVLIPDHPALAVYRHVVGELERVVGTRLVEGWPADLPEPQGEESTPILPRVGRAIGLSFTDGAWRSGARSQAPLDLDAFLLAHFRAGRTGEAVGAAA